MKSINFIKIVILLVCFNTQAQTNSVVVFKKELNNLIKQREGSLNVFQVVTTESSDTIRKPSIKKVSNKYKKAYALVSKTKKEYEAAKNENNEVDKHNLEIKKLQNNVSNFIVSKEDFASKKYLLVDAQKLSDKHNLGFLIYADAKINSKFKSKFFILSRNKLDLKIHLKKLVVKMNSSIIPVKQKDNSEKQEQYEFAKQKLKKTRKYNTIKGEVIINRYATHELGQKVYKPENVLEGRFKVLREYYILKNDEGVYMASVADVERKGLKKEKFVFEQKLSFVKNIKTNDGYLVFNDFIEQHLMNSIQVSDNAGVNSNEDTVN